MAMGCGVYDESIGKQAARRQFAGSLLQGLTLPILVLLLTLGATTGAQAVTYIPFDADVSADGYSYGFKNPGAYGITSHADFDKFYQASSSPLDDPSVALLNVDRVSIVRCARASDGCNSNHQVFDVTWDVTFNADILTDPSLAYDVDLILVDSDFDPIFDGNEVSVDYESGSLDGSFLELRTARLDLGAGYHFIDFNLGSMMNGETKRIGFTYQVNNPLPDANGNQVGVLFPLIAPGAFSTAFTVVPEPGTATLLGLGLAALAVRRNRA